MIKLENVILPSQEQMKFIIQGMRNPMNSWEKSDSGRGCYDNLCGSHCTFSPQWCGNTPRYVLGENDHSLMQRLSNAGTEHRKYMRMMPVHVRITAPLYWWKEFDTYKVGTVANSCSTMHKIAEKEFTMEDFSLDKLQTAYNDDPMDAYFEGNTRWGSDDAMNIVVKVLNYYRNRYIRTKDKFYWWQLIQLLPSSYNQTRNVMMNYEVLANIYKQRKNHKLDEWREFCKWIEELPYSELVTTDRKYGKEE